MTSLQRISRRSVLKTLAVAGSAATIGPLIRTRPLRALPAGLRFGIQPSQVGVRYEALRRVWLDAEENGLDTAFLADHLISAGENPDQRHGEAWMTLAALAAETERIEIGTLVTCNGFRNPAVLAKMAATVEQVSRGRLIFGIGAGWMQREHEAYGVPFHDPGERARRLVETVEVFRRLFETGRANYDGEYYDLRDAPFAPGGYGRERPPILIGGKGPRVVQPLAARHADSWHYFDGFNPRPDHLRQVYQRFDKLCEGAGRDPNAVERCVYLPRNPESASDLRRRMHALIDVGVRHFIFFASPPNLREAGRWYAKQIVPWFR